MEGLGKGGEGSWEPEGRRKLGGKAACTRTHAHTITIIKFNKLSR
jgi:hypothetical protein